ncbi:MAG: hypothetical protein RLZZ135_2322 [Cyanobacteriota bacterium]
MEDSCAHSISIKSDPGLAESYRPLVRSVPLPQCEICVIVPVRNEAKLLPACLKALAEQTDLEGRSLNFNRYEVILLANNCTDNSVEIARQFARQHPEFQLHIIDRVLPPAEAYIGRVRQILMDEAYYRLAGLGLAGLGSKSGVIASTDGDTQVATTWIAATLLEISRGVDAVGGRIVADPTSCAALDPQVRERYLRGDYYHQLIVELETYLDGNPHDRWPRHAQHYGASFAVTAHMYREAGGMPAVRTPEDVAFYRALLRVGAKFRHSPLVEVTTSARQTVRTVGGFAAQLNEWQELGQKACLVESAAAIETRFQTRRQLRQLWCKILNGYQHTRRDAIHYASTLGICGQWLWMELTQPQPFDLLFEQVEASQHQDGVWQKRWPLVNLDRAIVDLNTRLQDLRPQPIRVLPHQQLNSSIL